MIVRLVNPASFSNSHRGGGEKGGNMSRRHHRSSRRRRNPFGVGSMNQLAIKVSGGLAGGIAAAAIPNMVMPSLATGWPGVAAALAIAFGGSMLFKSSKDFSEGVLIGGTLQAAGRVSSILLGKNVVSFSLGGYGPMQFPLPTPGYNMQSPQLAATVPASASKTSPAPAVATMGKWSARGYKFAA